MCIKGTLIKDPLREHEGHIKSIFRRPGMFKEPSQALGAGFRGSGSRV